MAETLQPRRFVSFANFEVDLQAGELRKAGVRLKLTGQPFQVLAILLERPGEVVTREELQKRLWPDTFVDVDHNLNTAINKIREVLGDSSENPGFVETLPRRGYRFIAPLNGSLNDEAKSGAKVWKALVPAVVVLAALAVGVYFYAHRKPKLTEKDTVVVADFANTTGDPVFDDSLKRALAVSLGQSPLLSLVSDERVRETLQMMGKPAGTALNQEVVREVCVRTQSKAMVLGTISAVDTQYLLTLEAVNCGTGASLGRTGAKAESKAKVLDALGQATSDLRGKLGESLASVQKYDVPLEEATTSSLEALKTYSLGLKVIDEKGSAAAIPYFRRAIELDPNFAEAYWVTAIMYGNIGETELASEYAQRAYTLRDRVTELEKLDLELTESSYVTGDLVKDEENFERHIRTYPRDPGAYVGLSADRAARGDYEGEIANVRKSLDIVPKQSIALANLAEAYMALNRLDEAKSALDHGVAIGIEPEVFLTGYYNLAFLRKDEQGMQKQFELAMGKSDYEDAMLSIQSDTEAYHGRLKKAREYSRRAMDSAKRNGTTEVVGVWVVTGALREAIFGNSAEAKKDAASAIQIAPRGRYLRGVAALALAVAGDRAQAQRLADELAAEYPQDTLLNGYWLPMVHAQIALNRHDPTRALEMLGRAQSYEMGMPTPHVAALGVLYLRGYAYLGAGQNKEAATEFQRIVEHPGIVQNSAIGPLAHLGLGRALAAGGETANALAAYQDFFALWRDADPDVPVLKQAKAEYAKLQ